MGKDGFVFPSQHAGGLHRLPVPPGGRGGGFACPKPLHPKGHPCYRGPLAGIGIHTSLKPTGRRIPPPPFPLDAAGKKRFGQVIAERIKDSHVALALRNCCKPLLSTACAAIWAAFVLTAPAAQAERIEAEGVASLEAGKVVARQMALQDAMMELVEMR